MVSLASSWTLYIGGRGELDESIWLIVFLVADERLAVARAMSRADIRDLKTRRLAARAMAGPPQIRESSKYQYTNLSGTHPPHA